jgi:NTE family protein
MNAKKVKTSAPVPGKTTAAGPVPALVLSGGGARSLFQIGVMEELCKAEDPRFWTPKILSGTSSGAVNAAFFAAGHSTQQMIDFWLEVGRGAPVQLDEHLVRWVTKHILLFIYKNITSPLGKKAQSLKTILEFLRKKGTWRLVDLLVLAIEHVPAKKVALLEAFVESIESESIFTTAPFRRKLIHAFGGEELPAMTQTVILNAMDKHTKELVRMSNHKLTPQKSGYIFNPRLHVDHLLASCSVPVLFNAVLTEDRTLWDGLLLGNTAMAPAAAFGATHILPILTKRIPLEDLSIKS